VAAPAPDRTHLVLTAHLGIRVALLLDAISACPKEFIMVATREEAARRAEATKTNVPGTCQLVTRGYFLAPSAGDFDGDGRADAEDGWKHEPIHARHFDRNPPRGVPVSFLGGSHDDGHRAISIGGPAPVRSTDFNGVTKRYQAGVVGNGTIDEVARAMGVTYAGWSDTIDGILIPDPKPTPKPAPKPTRPPRVTAALKRLRERRAKIAARIKRLRGIKPR
jgi:hypothetical protein